MTPTDIQSLKPGSIFYYVVQYGKGAGMHQYHPFLKVVEDKDLTPSQVRINNDYNQKGPFVLIYRFNDRKIRLISLANLEHFKKFKPNEL